MADPNPVAGRLSAAFRDNQWLQEVGEHLLIQSRVVYAVIMREARTRYGHSDLGYFWAVFDPLIELCVLVVVFTFVGRTAPTPQPLPVFLVMGMLPFNFMRSCLMRGGTAGKADLNLLVYPQVKMLDLVFGRVILEFATLAVVYMAFMVGLDLVAGIPFNQWYDDPLGMSLAIISLFYMGTCLAVLSSGLTRMFPVWPTIFSYLSRPLWFLSAIFYTLEHLPQGPRSYIIYNPLAHMVEWFRSASSPVVDSPAYSLTMIFTFATISVFVGLGIERLLARIGYSDWSG